MRILTLNTHSWREENQEEKMRYLAEIIKERDYDIIALQEINQSTASPYLQDRHLRRDNFMVVLQQLIEKIGGPKYNSFWDLSKVVRDEYEEGSAILCKMPITHTSCFTVSKSRDRDDVKARKIVKVTVTYKEQEIDLYSCHLGWWHDEIEPFEYQCDRLVEEMDSDKLSLLMGDFNNNANLREEGYDYLIDKGFYDTYILAGEKDQGVTVQGEIAGWKGNKVGLRIDLILVNKTLTVKSSKVIFNGDYKNVVSDHYGVEVELELED